jgi:hypothetical protein
VSHLTTPYEPESSHSGGVNEEAGRRVNRKRKIRKEQNKTTHENQYTKENKHKWGNREERQKEMNVCKRNITKKINKKQAEKERDRHEE